ncbi:C40 family peptidase [Paraburkholderia acidisoli]|uniref:Peptidoglycan endopeptidase n=1 Tax=Paraburkholderia acidisoli TaxID=2571748 RepID=A0A7Z2GGY3_9BURK|nr:C40 family peptidase [Paraburkholderia acidisoli]QGZ61606.1 peptidoglycan endopeptidase [Paraburkholderia acidisoli]
MRRLWLPFLIVVLLAACSSAPQRVARGGGASGENAWRTKPPGFPNFVDHSVGREEISIQAMGLVGIPYRWGGNTPDSGFDCSGLVKYVMLRSASVDLPRTTAEMSTRGESIEPDEIAPGDLVFFNTTGRPHSHVGIYVGKLRFVNAPSTGGTVRLDYLTNPYWAKHFDGIRRMAPPKRTPFDSPTYEASAPAERTPAATGGTPVVAGAMVSAPAAAAPPPARVAASVAPATNENRALAAPQTAYVPTQAAPASAASADAFEPPPASLNAAQAQSRGAGAVAPTAAPGFRAPGGPAPTSAAPAYAARPTPASAETAAPRDAIDAAADAFEPPPPVARAAERQAAQAGSTAVPSAAPTASNAPYGQNVQIMRASTAGTVSSAPTQTNDDPIARFANGSY